MFLYLVNVSQDFDADLSTKSITEVECSYSRQIWNAFEATKCLMLQSCANSTPQEIAYKARRELAKLAAGETMAEASIRRSPTTPC